VEVDQHGTSFPAPAGRKLLWLTVTPYRLWMHVGQRLTTAAIWSGPFRQRRMSHELSHARIVVLVSATDDEHLARAMQAGATFGILARLGLQDRVQAPIFALHHEAG
jgi:hypothetical protein